MNKEKFSILKKKITPKETVEIKYNNQDKFAIADNILVPIENVIKKSLVLRKTFSIPEEEVIKFKKIRNRALDYRVVISDSEIVRLGLSLVYSLEDKDFQEKILNINKLTTGRPKSL
jgi:hypothetical protein